VTDLRLMTELPNLEEVTKLGMLCLTKARLLKLGWRFQSDAFNVDGKDRFKVMVLPPADVSGDYRFFNQDTYTDALDAALKFASHLQARKEAR
jgi:hypothetical protein